MKDHEGKKAYAEHWVSRGRHRIYAREYEGEDPAIVLMHGFPDNLHLYDRLMPHLSGRRVIAFVSVTGSFLLARRFLGERLASGRPLGASSV